MLPPTGRKRFKFGTFNAERLGKAKLSKLDWKAFFKILNAHDIIVLQEIRGRDVEIFEEFFDSFVQCAPNFNFIISEPEGYNRYKERYAVVYRADLFDVTPVEFDNPYCENYSTFRRPFIVNVVPGEISLPSFTVFVVHTTPNRNTLIEELEKLYRAVENFHADFPSQNLMIAGDLNTGTNYIKDLYCLSLRCDERITWIGPDNLDTTARRRNQAYDRILVMGEELTRAVNGSILNVQQFPTTREGVRISDHLPVELIVNALPENEMRRIRRKMLNLAENVQVRDNIPEVFRRINQRNLQKLRESTSCRQEYRNRSNNNNNNTGDRDGNNGSQNASEEKSEKKSQQSRFTSMPKSTTNNDNKTSRVDSSKNDEDILSEVLNLISDACQGLKRFVQRNWKLILTVALALGIVALLNPGLIIAIANALMQVCVGVKCTLSVAAATKIVAAALGIAAGGIGVGIFGMLSSGPGPNTIFL